VTSADDGIRGHARDVAGHPRIPVAITDRRSTRLMQGQPPREGAHAHIPWQPLALPINHLFNSFVAPRTKPARFPVCAPSKGKFMHLVHTNLHPHPSTSKRPTGGTSTLDVAPGDSSADLDAEIAELLGGGSDPVAESGPAKITFVPTSQIGTGGQKLKWNARFAAIPHAVLVDPTFAELSGRALKLLLAVLSQFVGNNNGHLTATPSRMKAFGLRSKDSLAKSIQELIDFGYIVRTRSQECRLPALYAITWLPLNKAPKGQPYDPGITSSNEASDLWRHIDPLKAKGKVQARRNAAKMRKLGLEDRGVVSSPEAAATSEALH